MAEDRDKVEELITYLRSLGFEGEKLEADIRQKYEKSNAAFIVRHRIAVGEEMIQYNLRFLHDRMFKAYRLDGYRVIYRDPLIIEHKTINGINTRALEEKMKTIDWDEYFSGQQTGYPEPKGNAEGMDLAPIQEVERQLYKLGEAMDFGGQEIQGQLMFKYWSEEFWSDEAVELHTAHGNTMDFKVTEHGIPNAILARNMVSGQLEKLYHSLSKTGIEQYLIIDLKSLLSIYLSRDSEGFEISCTSRSEEGFISFRIPVTKVEDGYHADTNHAEFTPYPEIEHGVFNGVDTLELEERIRQINWETEELYTFDELGDVVLLPHIQEVEDAISRLDNCKQAKYIAEYLQLRYWSGCFMETYIDERTLEMENWSSVKQQFILVDDTRTISNLMRGRPVHATQLKTFGDNVDGWFVINPAAVSEDRLNLELIEGLDRQQVETMVDMLPLDGTEYIGDIVRSIMCGEMVPVRVNDPDAQREIVASANPKERRLELRTAEGLAIPFNFRLDPNWYAEQKRGELQLPEFKNKEKTTPKTNKRKKGKGLR